MGNSPTHDKRPLPSHEPYRTSDVDVDKGIFRHFPNKPAHICYRNN